MRLVASVLCSANGHVDEVKLSLNWKFTKEKLIFISQDSHFDDERKFYSGNVSSCYTEITWTKSGKREEGKKLNERERTIRACKK